MEGVLAGVRPGSCLRERREGSTAFRLSSPAVPPKPPHLLGQGPEKRRKVDSSRPVSTPACHPAQAGQRPPPLRGGGEERESVKSVCLLIEKFENSR